MRSLERGMFPHPELHFRCAFVVHRTKNTLLSFTYFFW